MKLIKLFICIFTIFFIFGCKADDIRKELFPAPMSNYFPQVSNHDIKIKIKNNNRTVNALLSNISKSLIVMFHGNGSTMDYLVDMAKSFNNYGYSTLLVEYPGYGVSKGYETSENNIYSDSEAVVKFVSSKYNFLYNDINLFGFSLGTGVAVELAKRHLGTKLILVAPFTSIPDIADREFLNKPADYLIVDKFANISKAKNIKIPVLLIHGTNDTAVPYNMSVKLLKKFPKAKLLTIKNAEHSDIFTYFNNEVFERIINFFNAS